jgi:hypothetical protein
LLDGQELDTISWPYSRSGVPKTIYVPLGEGIGAKETGEGQYICIPGRDEAIEKRLVSFLVLVSGTVLDSGNSYISAKEFEATNMTHGHFQEIDPNYESPPRTWSGWHNFDGNSEIYIFGYASLVSPESVESTLGHSVDRSEFSYAMLAGWRRAWNVGSDKSSHPERTFRLHDGSDFDGVTVVLGIAPTAYQPGCYGSVFPVDRYDLSFLDIRERNYRRIEVTDRVTWAGKPENCTVYTYLPLEEATQRIADARAAGRALNIRKGYVDLVEEAFRKIGKLDAYRDSTPLADYQIQEMTSVIDPALAPARVKSSTSSYFGNAADSPAESRELAASDDTGAPATASFPLAEGAGATLVEQRRDPS